MAAINPWSSYVNIADGIAKLFSPWVEVVIHDFSDGKIAHIAGNFSKRRVGDPSLFDETEKQTHEALIGPYVKTNIDGRQLKSLSVPIRQTSGEGLMGMLCINADTSALLQLRSLIDLFCQTGQTPELGTYFTKNWQDQINEFVAAFLQRCGKRLTDLNRKEKQELTQSLYESGAFEEKNAAVYIARALGISRASVYAYLKNSQ